MLVAQSHPESLNSSSYQWWFFGQRDLRVVSWDHSFISLLDWQTFTFLLTGIMAKGASAPYWIWAIVVASIDHQDEISCLANYKKADLLLTQAGIFVQPACHVHPKCGNCCRWTFPVVNIWYLEKPAGSATNCWIVSNHRNPLAFAVDVLVPLWHQFKLLMLLKLENRFFWKSTYTFGWVFHLV